MKKIIKKIIGLVIASMMFANIGYAEIKFIEKKIMPDAYTISTVRVDGYKFVVMRRVDGVSMVQFWKRSPYSDLPPLPAKC